MAITLRGHPPSAREVAFEREPRAVGLGVRVDAQHDPRNFTSVGTLFISIKHAHVCDHVLVVVLSEGCFGWGYISDKWRRFHH